ncbi:DUF6216 family protein [Candidatus Pantoea multigeneris]|uniref:Uncharacterized protein n=1 Tax=Candidatus Pantoea multigeneris TaxID=2608357 RepID=A0ABX0RBT8_9GAMM|nr:DUF6216 family protein [Pantoea multigeneris]NIF21842.1 hypothetical protein [Pantoea multigeneris]
MSDIVKDYILPGIGSLATIGAIIFCLYLRSKSTSSSVIINKLWALFVGEKDYYNPVINEFAKHQHDVDKFNLSFDFSFKDTSEIERFLKWVKINSYQIYYFTKLGGLFFEDTTSTHVNFKIKIIKRYKCAIVLGLTIVFFSASFLLINSKIFGWITWPKTGLEAYGPLVVSFEFIVAGCFTLVESMRNYKAYKIKKLVKSNHIKIV